MISILLGYVLSSSENPIIQIWFLQQPWLILLVFLFVIEVFRAVMERKYHEVHNTYKLTVGRIVFTLMLFFILLGTDFFGL
ncbi:DUF4181 domain-containing protein [Sporosarcina obsidiansis]|uniref:DUF4181 domain-containing protein n=1 Tax=Sporosarcina obsidiansis TaxID=2660748 RepID=UPI0021022348|nr:DUF4181 domain-containing protein [Sporosarcina obsidiansis]